MVRKVSETFQETLLRHDPGLAKLAAAIRGTATVISSYFLLSPLAKQFGQSPLIAFLGVIISLMTSLLVSDPSHQQQKITLLYSAILTSAALALGIFLAQWHWLQLTVFLILVFISVFIRKYGSRGIALGILIFMAYFCSLFFPLHSSSIPYATVAILISVGLTYIVRFVILPDRPRLQLRLARLSFRLQLIRTLKKLAVYLGESEPHQHLLVKLRPELRMINQLSFEGESRITSEDLKLSPEEKDHFRTQLFEVELSVRRAIESSWVLTGTSSATADQIRMLQEDLWKIAETPWENASQDQLPRLLFLNLKADSRAVSEVQSALSDILRRWVFALYDPKAHPELSMPPEKILSPIALTPTAAPSTLVPNVLTALQATLATGLATWIGTYVSVDRWYWASAAAFILFTGAARGETVTRAVYRVLGTVLGLIAGFLIAYTVNTHRIAEGTLIFVCAFWGIYLARSAYGFWTAMWFTSLLALFYDLLGQMTMHVLILRLEETFIGALMSGLVAFFIFPISTRGSVRKALAKLLDLAALVLEEVPQKSASPFARRELIRRIRTVDQELYNVRMAAGPLQGKMLFTSGNELSNVIHDASLLTHFIRRIATTLAGELTADQIAQIESLAKSLRTQANLFNSSSKKAKAPSSPLRPRVAASIQDTELAHWSDRIQQILEAIHDRVF